MPLDPDPLICIFMGIWIRIQSRGSAYLWESGSGSVDLHIHRNLNLDRDPWICILMRIWIRIQGSANLWESGSRSVNLHIYRYVDPDPDTGNQNNATQQIRIQALQCWRNNSKSTVVMSLYYFPKLKLVFSRWMETLEPSFNTTRRTS